MNRYRLSALLALLIAGGACSDDSRELPMAPALEENTPTLHRNFAALASGWTTRAPMPTPRVQPAVAAADGIVYAIGGRTGGDFGTVLQTVEAYDTKANSWATKAPIPLQRFAGNGAVTIGGKIYVAGGADANGKPTRTLFVYSPRADKWKRLADMPSPAASGASVKLGGKLVVYSPAGSSGGVARLLRYDPGQDRWTELAAPNEDHREPAAGVIDGKLYLAGGMTLEPSILVEVYDPVTNTWTPAPSLIAGRFGAAGAVLGRKLYVIGAGNGFSIRASVQVFDPVKNRWDTGPAMKTARGRVGAVAVNGAIYAIGGADAVNSQLGTNEALKP